MTREEQLEHCRVCQNRELTLQREIVCKLSGEKADFDGYCPNMVMDYDEQKRLDALTAEGPLGTGKVTHIVRLGAYLIDRVVILLISLVFGMVLGVFLGLFYPDVIDWLDEDHVFFRYFLGFILVSLYYIIFEGITGKTAGKILLGTAVVDINGDKPPFNTIIIRTLCRFIPFDAFSFLGEDVNGWHDSISKTTVISTR